MDIFVRTRGLELSQDYDWIKAHNNSQISEKPPLIIEKRNTQIDIDNFIETKYFSLVFYGKKNYYLLYVTGLSSQFKDASGTAIRNSICFLTTNNNDELKIRGLIVSFLKNKQYLEDSLKACILRQENGSVQLDTERISSFIRDIETSTLLSSDKIPPQDLKKINVIKNSDTNINELVSTVEKYSLKNENDIFIIVTTNITDERLKQAGVWRGLTDIISPPSSNQKPLIEQFLEKIRTTNFRRLSIVFVVFFIGSIGLGLVVKVINANQADIPLPALQIIIRKDGEGLYLNLNYNLPDSNTNKLYYIGGFTESRITKQQELEINNNRSGEISRIDGPNPSKLNTEYKFLISDHPIVDEEIQKLFQTTTNPTTNQCKSKVNQKEQYQYPVRLCITTPPNQ